MRLIALLMMTISSEAMANIGYRSTWGCTTFGFCGDRVITSIAETLILIVIITSIMACGYFAVRSRSDASMQSDTVFTSPLELLINTRGATGGLAKRIDENREIMNLIYTEAPELVAKNPWLVGWLNANDEFFTQLAAITPPKEKRRYGMYPNRPDPIRA